MLHHNPPAERHEASAGEHFEALLDTLLAKYAPGFLAVASGEMQARHPKARDPSATMMTARAAAMTTSPPPPSASAALLRPAAAIGRDCGPRTRAMPQQQQCYSPGQPANVPGSADRLRSRARMLTAIQQLAGRTQPANTTQQQQHQQHHQQQQWPVMQLPEARDIHPAAGGGMSQHPLQQAPGAGAAGGCHRQQVQHEQAAWQGRLMPLPAGASTGARNSDHQQQQQQLIDQLLQRLLDSSELAVQTHQRPQMTQQLTVPQQQLPAMPHAQQQLQQQPQQRPQQQQPPLAHPLLAAGAEDDLFEALDSWLEAERAAEEANALGSSLGSSLGSVATAAGGSYFADLLLVDGAPTLPVQPQVQRRASDGSVAGRPVSPNTPFGHNSGLAGAAGSARDAAWSGHMRRQLSEGSSLHQTCFTDSLATIGSAMSSPLTAFAGVSTASLPQPLTPNACSSSSNTSSSLPPRAPSWQAPIIDGGGRVLKRSWSEPVDTAKRACLSGRFL